MSTDEPSIPLVQQPQELYGSFVGPIDSDAVKRLSDALALASQRTVPRFHILFHSSGGGVSDGICLYNLFRASPVPITLYNVGGIASAAVVAYLGADGRKTSAQATFMMHRTTCAPQAAEAKTLEALAESVGRDNARTEEILRLHIRLSKSQWNNLDRPNAGIVLSAEQAVKYGLADAIADFAPPKHQPFYSL